MSKIYLLLFNVCCLLGVCVGQIVQDGQCDPDVPLDPFFDLELFGGTWYELLKSDTQTPNIDCTSFEFTESNDTYFNTDYKGIKDNFAEISTGNLSVVTNGSPKFILDIPLYNNPIDFWILLSNENHTHFAVAYNCENITETTRSIQLWVLGRTRDALTGLTNLLINLHLNETLGIELASLNPIDHSPSACYELPVIEPGQSIIIPGECNDEIPAQQAFNVAEFIGTWHEISSYYTESSVGGCIRAEYSVGDGVVDVLNSQVINQTLLSITGNASVISDDQSAKLKVMLNVDGNQILEQELWVLATDYENYAISYSCENLPDDEKRIYSWILSRQRELSPAAQEAVNNVINSVLELNDVYYTPTDQSPEACFFFPEPSDDPVVFRGQCDMNIPAMPSFDPVQYMGLWHTIELYPTLFQDGTCSNAHYTLIDGNVDVLNTQVKNETLDTVTAVAVLASDDGSAKLRVTFPVAGTDLTITTDYWVLDTNYTSYALVYSCSNIDDDNMQVGSWKLSRAKTLNSEDSLAIEVVMNTTNVLDQRYFNEVNQTEEGCFFVPTPEEGVPVVFPGQCDPNLGMQNFNLAQFEGTWYEIQAYPKEEQSGQCINHNYTFVSNSELSLISTAIDDNFLSQTQGKLISTDSTGRLTINITSGDENIEIAFWIIDTDYTSYALAYTCVDRPGDLRTVWSWKLSRTQQLTSAAETEINKAMADIDVLDNVYFWNIDHSDQACFVLPVIPFDQPVIIPGLCDSSIKGISNFNLAEFTGRWRLIQSYYSEFQSGTCNEANYSLLNAQTVDVANIQVVNETLNNISGNATISSSDGTGALQFLFDNNVQSSEYIILDTDYSSYALAYSCQNLTATNQRRVWSWKLSRDNILSDAANININQIIDTIDVLNKQYYQTVDHTEAGCFYFPEVDPSSPVKFRGQCNESIPAVTNFDPVQYMGLWHDIQSYPEDFQNGTCQNADYTLVGGVVDVFNTQVINQTLDTMSGTAVIASDDGSAKLNVTFNVGGVDVTTNYWVLATDYNSYALVYSCRQLDEEYYQVSSWKLSRTRDLKPESVAEITAVTNGIPVLDDKYYINRNQTAADCFYFPEPKLNEPVIFPGQCDDNIEAKANFSSTQFAGLWHEIEKYPYSPTDTCIDHRLELLEELSSSTFNHNSFHVLNQTLLLVNNSTMNLTSTDDSGRLTIDIVVNGEVQTIPFWILETDYFNYALAYGCRDLDNDFRQIYSWKLSRTRQPNNLPSFDGTMSDIEVLDNKYFQTIPQTDEVCFYLPDLQPNEPVTFIGQCDPNIPVFSNFNATEYLGTWRLIESYYAEFQGGSCHTAEYSADSNSVLVVNTQVVNQTLDTIVGTAVLASNDGSGKLVVNFPNSPTPSDYWILGTDYDSYALVYSCANISDDRRQVWSWKLSRSNTLTDAAKATISEIINNVNVLNEDYYNAVDRTEPGCFYFPEVDPSSPVRFRGQCNESIPAVTNFDPVQYMGLWHDIQSYPEDFQNGTCQNADYTLVGGVVDVFNTQVINQTLDTMSGTAVIASNDGSAKLNVTFNVGGVDVTTNYWVLATNYTSYALVYSCRQVDEEYYQVSSWKLSRTRELTIESIEEINAVTDQIPVLDDRYFINRNQSAEDCFYFPEPELNKPVIFPGQCDNDIAAVSNFNDVEFAGVWHEIEKYPYGPTDTCIDHRIELDSSSTFAHNSFHVLNQTLILVNNSTMNLTSTDGSGRLTIDIVVNEQVQTIPFWILETDYSNYALAYGCRDLDNDFRQIYSWKLSRSRQPDDLPSFNETMGNIEVLDNRYFQAIPQTDEACFYLPDIELDEPVTFIGQCDPNIPVVSNFNAEAYLGTWRLIETYYADFQTGTCNTAHYSSGNNEVIVFNTQVINQTLDSLIGTAVPATTDGSGKLTVNFPTSPTPSDYWILGTDYISYALVYSCQNISVDRRRVWSWKMSRTTSLTPYATAAIDNIVNNTDVLNDRYYQPVNNSDDGCFYYPEPNENITVVFPGQCDMSISAMANFDVEKFLNKWYDIESYPAPFQNGTCAQANYLLDDNGVVRVENTQVVNQLLETWIGSAVVASNDGSAILNVTFNVNGVNVTTNYWVLDTDYTSYALVYSCENITDDTRAVFSWKLSRYPTLSDVASQAIDNVIDTIPVLKQQYYVQRSHSEEDCFYYPDNEGGDVILPGQCLDDSAVPAVATFSAAAFAGRWYELSRFPSDVQQGECFTTEYSIGESNTLIAARSFVFDESQFNSTLEVTLSDDGRGVLSGNITGAPFNTVFILATDYEEYALAYSCRNLTDDQKQIYSWILGRSRAGLSDAANNTINELVFSNIDLWEGYYRPTGQDNDACFFYPAVEELPGAIILPGPCPNNIHGVSNFNAVAYLGKWYETARYFVENQQGQCNRAHYSLDVIDGIQRVAVDNNEVIDQTLLSQLGFADVASTDGTGQLNVEFDVNGVLMTANYYILATDYDSYSLIYSCTNLTGGWRQVSSWKLSRTKTQTSDEMDSVINATQGLNEKYYRPTSQSDEDCFYIPFNHIDRPPRFRGQCENITGVADFDVQKYLGWWHEIERYPVFNPEEAGECRSSQYAQDGSTYIVVDNWVRDNEGFVLPGTVTATSEGKLIRTMSDGKTQDIWVLATDYDTYALLYACEQVDDEYREVWSAKHSKSRSLSEAAQNDMASTIEDNIVLYPIFYKNVDQSDNTCFHYPTIAEGEDVIIPGQCNLNIPVVENFNIGDFAGTWYQTERYDAVTGTSCVGSRFTAENSETITVTKVEVSDGETLNTEGTVTVDESSGLVQFTVPTPGSEVNTTTSWYILDTDYTSYAVAYNCINIDTYRRQIRAWKLSRERSLPLESSVAIEALISKTQELHQPYFNQISQNNDCPEPSSALFIKSSVVLLMICAMFQWLL